MLMLPAIIACSIISPARVSVVHDTLAEFTAETIDLDEPEHGHDEHDTSLLEHNLIDVSVPTITGGFLVSYQSPTFLLAANRGMGAWWVTTRLGKPVVFDVRFWAKARKRASKQRTTT